MGAIFISYRRSDSQGEAGRLFDDLVNHFGEDLVFMDVAGIEAGRDFRKAIEESVAKCGVLLVVMGPEWLNAKDKDGARRLDDPSDFVRLETASALKRDVPVIPVLVRGAQMPRPEQLPEDLKELAYRNCVELTHARWRSDIHLLIEALRRLLGGGVPAERPRAAEMRVSSSRQPVSVQQRTGDSLGMDADAVERVSRELALHIGPIADIVVRRAAQRCASLDELYLQVAEEIESPSQREKFLSGAAAGTSSSFHAASTDEPRKINLESLKPPPQVVEGDGNSAPARAIKHRERRALLVLGGGLLLVLLVVAGVRLAGIRGQGGARAPHSTLPQAPEPISARNEPPPSAESLNPVAKTAIPATTEESRPRPTQRVRVSQGVAQGLLISKVVPAYPPLARQGRIQGAVVLEANISKNGTVENLRLISGHPMLVSAAIEAVKQWRYKPFLVNGEATPIDTQVEVVFTLTGG